MKMKTKGKKKKVVTALVVVALIVIGGLMSRAYMMKKGADTEAQVGNYDEIKAQDLVQTASVTGAIISAQTEQVNAGTVNAYPVKSVDVHVGDAVKAGDVLFTLDMKAMEEDLKLQKQALAAQQNGNQYAIDVAKRQAGDAQKAADQANQQAQNAAAFAQADLDAANQNVAAIADKLNNKRAEEANLLNAYNAETDDTKRAELKTQYQAAAAESKSLEADLTTAQNSAAEAQRSVTNTALSYEMSKTSGAATMAGQNEAINKASMDASSNTLSMQQSICKSEEELSKAEVKASMDGVVTDINVQVGQNYNGTGGVVISDTANLLASANVDEAVISKITEGMEVSIKTDATGDQILKGKVVYVSPTATKNSSGNGSQDQSGNATAGVSTARATYRVDVALDEANPDLRIGMTAKMNFNLAEAKGALTVPTMDIMEDEDGSKYILVEDETATAEDAKKDADKKADQTKDADREKDADKEALAGTGKEVLPENAKKIPVTIGVQTDFYSEVHGAGLKEGMKVLQSATDESESVDEVADTIF